ncbi:MAG: hypothetical protein ABIC04_07600 [Nanoarchaeota archaeon]
MSYWGIDNKNCIFQKDNMCKVYDKRPLMCRSYPIPNCINESGLPMQFLVCKGTKNPGQFVESLRNLDSIQMNNKFREFFGDEIYESSLQNTKTEFEILKHIKNWIVNRIIVPDQTFPYKLSKKKNQDWNV